MSQDRPDFRADLEGLRGLAILLVVLFHAGVTSLAGGFVGVDVFFVLSGFFITGILVRELDASGSIDLNAFYGRRALRLLPPLFVVLLVTLGLVMWLYAPIDRPDIASTARAVALSAGNVHFAAQSVGYFSSNDNPLLHTWSLGVEQQFYLVWPLLLLGVVLASRTRAALVGGLAVAGALSLGASVWMTGAAQTWAFYGMPTRVWEFALGGLLALTLGMRALGAATSTMLQVGGLLAIGFAMLTYDRGTQYPGLAALLPAFGGAALVAGGHDASETFVSRALGWGGFRWLGRLSYAWYLWHWPLVGLGAVLDPAIGPAGNIAWSLGALALAWGTYHVVERSAKDGRLASIPVQRLTLVAFGASVVAALVAQGALIVARRQAARAPQAIFAAAREDHMVHKCWATTVAEPTGRCFFGDTTSKTVVALLGDSHAEHWLGGLDRVGRERGWKIVAMVKGGCPVAVLPDLARKAKRNWDCAEYREAMVKRIIEMKPTIAVLSSWDHYAPVNGRPDPWQVTSEAWGRGLRETYARLSAAGIPTVALRGTPRTWFDVPQCLSRAEAHIPFAGDCTYDRASAFSPATIAAQTKAAEGLAVRFVDMNDQICARSRCGVVRNGTVIFTDDNHLTASFTRSLAPVLGPRVRAAALQMGVVLP